MVICDNGIGIVNARQGALDYSISRSPVRQIKGMIDIRRP